MTGKSKAEVVQEKITDWVGELSRAICKKVVVGMAGSGFAAKARFGEDIVLLLTVRVALQPATVHIMTCPTMIG